MPILDAKEYDYVFILRAFQSPPACPGHFLPLDSREFLWITRTTEKEVSIKHVQLWNQIRHNSERD